MCGRYYIGIDIERIIEWYELEEGLSNYTPPAEVFPAQQVPVVINGGQEQLKICSWGFKVNFTSRPIINARGETVDQKPLFKKFFYKQRCLIPATAFFEWKNQGGKKEKYKISIKDNDIFSMAGLYGKFKDNKGKKIDCCTIITTNANQQLKEIHQRMPLIIEQKYENKWLDLETSISKLKDFIKPYPKSLHIEKENEQLSFNFN